MAELEPLIKLLTALWRPTEAGLDFGGQHNSEGEGAPGSFKTDPRKAVVGRWHSQLLTGFTP